MASSPDLIVPKYTPLDVYQSHYASIEHDLKRECKELAKAFKDYQELLGSTCFQLLCLTKGIRSREAELDTSNAHKAMIQKLLEPNSNGNAEEVQHLQAARESMPIIAHRHEEMEKDYRAVDIAALMSLVQFFSRYEDWRKTGGKIKVASGLTVSKTLQLDLTKYTDTALANDDTLTMDRLCRLFRGSFLLKPTTPRMKQYQKIWIRSDSAFFENVLLPLGHSKKIMLEAVVLANKEGSKALTNETVVYLQLDLQFVLEALVTSMKEIGEVLQESGDDVA